MRWEKEKVSRFYVSRIKRFQREQPPAVVLAFEVGEFTIVDIRKLMSADTSSKVIKPQDELSEGQVSLLLYEKPSIKPPRAANKHDTEMSNQDVAELLVSQPTKRQKIQLVPNANEILESYPTTTPSFSRPDHGVVPRQSRLNMIDSLCMFDNIPKGARQSAIRRIQQLRNDQHSQALRPKDWGELENMALAVSVGMYHCGAASTKHGDELWRAKYWQPFRLYYQLPDVLIAPAITDVEGLEREAFTLAVYFMWIAKRMIPRAKASVAPKPDSVMQVVRSLLRMQKHGGHRCSKGACWMVSLLLDGMKHLYLDEHGQDSLQPSRKEPFNGDSLQKLLDLRSHWEKLSQANMSSITHRPIFVYSPQPPRRRRECVKRATRITN